MSSVKDQLAELEQKHAENEKSQARHDAWEKQKEAYYAKRELIKQRRKIPLYGKFILSIWGVILGFFSIALFLSYTDQWRKVGNYMMELIF